MFVLFQFEQIPEKSLKRTENWFWWSWWSSMKWSFLMLTFFFLCHSKGWQRDGETEAQVLWRGRASVIGLFAPVTCCCFTSSCRWAGHQAADVSPVKTRRNHLTSFSSVTSCYQPWFTVCCRSLKCLICCLCIKYIQTF